MSTILFVDDDRDFRVLASEYIAEKTGCDVVQAGDGNDALAKWEEHNPELIVLDIMLPKRSGFLVMDKIRRDSENGGPTIIIVTALEGKRHEVYAQSFGVRTYMRKPFKLDDLSREVKLALAK